jgi:hypothetical protein
MLSQGHGEIYEIESAVMKLRPTEHKTHPEPENDSLLSDSPMTSRCWYAESQCLTKIELFIC